MTDGAPVALNIFTRVSLTSGVEPRAAEEPKGSMTRGVALQRGERGGGVYSSWLMMMAEKFALVKGETSRQLEHLQKKKKFRAARLETAAGTSGTVLTGGKFNVSFETREKKKAEGIALVLRVSLLFDIMGWS